MNTPLLRLLATVVRTIEGERTTRHYSDARNYTGPRVVPDAEAAAMIAKALGGFALDWRRVQDSPPPARREPVLVATLHGEVLPAVHDGQQWREVPGKVGTAVIADVVAWAPMPKAPDYIRLVGFPSRAAGA